MQSRYYDPKMGRFINADSYASTGQGLLGNNMFAYCNNNPTNMADPTGELGIGTLCTIGALVGGIIDYAKEVINNQQAGLSGYDAWVGEVNWGSVASSAFSGALSVVPGGGAKVLDIVGSAVIEHGVNYLCGDDIDGIDFVTDIIINAGTSLIPTEKISRTGKLPQFIRHIKDEAVEMGIKGTRKLLTYLGFKQATHVVTNSFYNSAIGVLSDAYASPVVSNFVAGVLE